MLTAAPITTGLPQDGRLMTSVKLKYHGTTLQTKPETMPQNAPSFVMRLLHTLMRPTGPQDDATPTPCR